MVASDDSFPFKNGPWKRGNKNSFVFGAIISEVRRAPRLGWQRFRKTSLWSVSNTGKGHEGLTVAWEMSLTYLDCNHWIFFGREDPASFLGCLGLFSGANLLLVLGVVYFCWFPPKVVLNFWVVSRYLFLLLCSSVERMDPFFLKETSDMEASICFESLEKMPNLDSPYMFLTRFRLVIRPTPESDMFFRGIIFFI